MTTLHNIQGRCRLYRGICRASLSKSGSIVSRSLTSRAQPQPPAAKASNGTMTIKFHWLVETEGAMPVGCSELLANQPPPRRGNDTRNKNGNFCCISMVYASCFLRGCGVMSLSKILGMYGCRTNEGQRCLSNHRLQARPWPECHQDRIPAAHPRANDLQRTVLAGQLQKAGADKVWMLCRWLIAWR
jgi:hypothetical protein